MNADGVLEMDLVTIKDCAVLQSGSIIQPHTFEGRVMRCRQINVGSSVTIGMNTIALSGAVIDDHAVIGSLSLVMKSEHVRTPKLDTKWSGALIQPVPFPPLEKRKRHNKKRNNRERRVELEQVEAQTKSLRTEEHTAVVQLSNPLVPTKITPILSTSDREGEIEYAAILDLFAQKDLVGLDEVGGLGQVAAALKCTTSQGIAEKIVESRRLDFGQNNTSANLKKQPISFLGLFAEACSDTVIILLAIAAIISIIFGMTLPGTYDRSVNTTTGWIEGTAIIISIIIVTVVGSISNYHKDKVFEDMESSLAPMPVRVRRDGREKNIDSLHLVVGDVVLVQSGSRITCDMLLICGSPLCDESAVTGESTPVKKSVKSDPFVLGGSNVTQGWAELLVVAVGSNTVRDGRRNGSSSEVVDAAGQTLLEQQLDVLVDDISGFGLAAAVTLLFGLLIKEGILISLGKTAQLSDFLSHIILAIALVVVAIPEGLPLSLTITLAFSMKAMMKDNCMARIASSCETMGAVTTIVCGKSGTLTSNSMTVVQGVVSDVEFVVDGFGLVTKTPQGVRLPNSNRCNLSGVDLRLMLRAIAFNARAKEQEIDGTVQWTGSTIDIALLQWVDTMGGDYKRLRASVPSDRLKKEYPFNLEKNHQAVTVEEDPAEYKTYITGAPESLLEQCTRYTDKSGQVVELDVEKKKEITRRIAAIMNDGCQAVCVAMKVYGQRSGPNGQSLFDEEPASLGDLVLFGAVGLYAPPRPEVNEAVGKCEHAGINITLVTGDSMKTATAVAKACGIYREDGWGMAMTGAELRHLHDTSKEALFEIVPRLKLLARATSQDKMILVQMLQELGDVVGMTTDSTRDAPSMKIADVSLALSSADDHAKDCADLILLDDGFASVVKAVLWGRCVNDNVRKFLQYQLSINFPCIVLTIVGSLASDRSKEPFTPVQLLWMNVIMDTLAAVALGSESPDEKILQRDPVFQEADLISNKMTAFIGLGGAFQIGIIFLHMFSSHVWLETFEGPAALCNVPDNSVGSLPAQWLACSAACTKQGGVFVDNRWCQQGDHHSTIIFNVFIWMQIFNIFNARYLYTGINPFSGIQRSLKLCLVVLAIAGFQVFAVEAAGPFMQTTSLSWKQWLVCIAFGASTLPIGLLIRLIPVADEIPQEVVIKVEHRIRINRLKVIVMKFFRKTKDSPAMQRAKQQLLKEFGATSETLEKRREKMHSSGVDGDKLYV